MGGDQGARRDQGKMQASVARVGTWPPDGYVAIGLRLVGISTRPAMALSCDSGPENLGISWAVNKKLEWLQKSLSVLY